MARLVNRTLLCAGVSLIAVSAEPAFAQASNAPAPTSAATDTNPGQQAAAPASAPAGADTIDDIVVTGFRGSLAKALDAKRNESASIDAILAEDIGKFPDQNLSESIQRIPGVALARDGGEGRQISVRGLGPQFTRVRINGLEALTTAGGADASGGTNRGRSFDFNVFASDLFNAITVRKTAEPSTEEGSLGATVDLRTARPFDYSRLTISASAQGSYNDLAKKASPRGAFMIADQTDDGKFGALISVAYTKRRLIEEGFSTVRWAKGSAFSPGFESALGSTCLNVGTGGATGTVVTPAPANCATVNDALHPRFPRYDRYIDDIRRLGMTSSLQFRPSDATLISIDGLYAKFKTTREEFYLEAPSLSVAGNCTAASRANVCGIADTEVTSATITSGAMLAGTFNDVDLRVENRLDYLSTTFKQLTGELSQKFGETVTLEVQGGVSSSVHDNPIQNTLTLDQFNVDNYSYDFTDRSHPTFNFGTANLTSPTAWTLSQIRLRAASASNEYKSIAGNLRWDVTDGFSVTAGGGYKKYDFKTRELRRSNGTTSNLEASIPAAVAATPLANFTRVIGVEGTNFLVPDYRVANALFSLTDPTVYNGAFRLGPEPSLANNNSVTEKDTAGFVQADFNQDFGGVTVRGNGGFRYVHTNQIARGFAFLNGGLVQSVSDRSYNDFLPSANLVIEPTEKLALRLAAAKVMSRPSLGSLPPGGSVSVSGANRTVSFGNPNLDPFRATTLDASIEWYFDAGSLLSLALFQKDIKSFIQTVTLAGVPFTGNPYGLPDSVAIAACGALYPTTCNPASNNWSFSVPTNSPGGKLRGLEVNFQMPFRFLPGFLGNTGTLLNYTHVTSRIDYLSAAGGVAATADLTGLSRNSANATLYYEDKAFSLRVSAAYRDKYLSRVPGQEVGTVFDGTNETFNVDASLQYSVTDQIKVTLEGINLTDAYQDQFNDSRNLLSVYHHTGREFLFGVRFNY